MTKLPRKITDDPYGAAILIRRLVMEQGIAYWRRYLIAFVLMGVAAGATAGSAYVLGQVINQAYINKDVPAHRHPFRRHGSSAVFQGRGDLRPHRDPVQDQQRHSRQQSAAAVRQADERKHRILFRAAFVRIPGAADGRREIHHRRPQHADQRHRPRSLHADRPDRRDGDAGSDPVVRRSRGGAAGDADAAQAGQAGQGARL